MIPTTVLLLVCAITSLSQSEPSDKPVQDTGSIDSCPPGYSRPYNTTSDCTCIRNKWTNTLECNKGSNSSSRLLLGYCMTYSAGEGLFLGNCPFVEQFQDVQNGYIDLPDNLSELNEFMCGKYNRQGLLCSDCREGLGPVVYSYNNHSCIHCSNHAKNMVLYMTLEILPITCLYVVLLFFQVNASNAPLHACLFFYQCIVIYLRVESEKYGEILYALKQKDWAYVSFETFMTIYGVFNLDFFRYVVPPFCVSRSIGLSGMKALEYISAVYPLFLILLTYTLITLHAHNCRPIVWLWKPFHKCFVHQRRRCNAKASIIDVFATFLLLSFSKIISVSLDVVMPVSIHNLANGKDIFHPYFAPESSYRDHGYYIVASVCLLVFLVVCPVLLLTFYNSKVAQRCRRHLRLRQWHALQTFIEAFQGEFKDGTVEGQRDMRFASSFYLVLRIILIGGMALTSTGVVITEIVLLNPVTMTVLSASILFFAIIRPYKDNRKNVMDSLILALLQLLVFWLLTVSYEEATLNNSLNTQLMLLLTTFPLFGLVGYIVYRLVVRIKKAANPAATEGKADNHSSDDKLPDRLLNPTSYASYGTITGANIHQATKTLTT